MTIILRLPAILVLFLLSAMSWAAAFAATVSLAKLPIDLGVVLDEGQLAVVQSFDWIQTGLWWAAGLFFLISAIRLIRRTQGFWVWLLGFACYGGRWALAQQGDGGLMATVRSIDPNAYLNPVQLFDQAADSPEAQLGVLGIALLVGLIIFLVDLADRAYWAKHEG